MKTKLTHVVSHTLRVPSDGGIGPCSTRVPSDGGIGPCSSRVPSDGGIGPC